MSGDYYKTLQSYGIKALCFSRLRGKANNEFNLKTPVPEFAPYYEDGIFVKNDGYMIPFGDGPSPMFKYRVAETMIMNMLNLADDKYGMVGTSNQCYRRKEEKNERN